jgi:hypothetical protein
MERHGLTVVGIVCIIVGIFSICLCAGLFFLLVFFMADKVPVAIFMANNTDDDVTVYINGTAHNLTKGRLIELLWFHDPKATISIHKKTSGLIWDFRWDVSRFQGKPYSSDPYLIHSRYYTQLERDATLYLLPYEIDAPVDNLPAQPPGYPLHAVVSEKGKERKKGG